MAASMFSRLCIKRPLFAQLPRVLEAQTRSGVTTRTGAIYTEPERIPLGFLKVVMTVIPGLWIGATLSKTGAAFLEENDIFVPAEDDDDDDD